MSIHVPSAWTMASRRAFSLVSDASSASLVQRAQIPANDTCASEYSLLSPAVPELLAHASSQDAAGTGLPNLPRAQCVSDLAFFHAARSRSRKLIQPADLQLIPPRSTASSSLLARSIGPLTRTARARIRRVRARHPGARSTGSQRSMSSTPRNGARSPRRSFRARGGRRSTSSSSTCCTVCLRRRLSTTTRLTPGRFLIQSLSMIAATRQLSSRPFRMA